MAKNKKRSPPPPPAPDAVPDGEKKPAAKTVNADAQAHLAEVNKLQLQITQAEEHKKEHDLRVAELNALELRLTELKEREQNTRIVPHSSFGTPAGQVSLNQSQLEPNITNITPTAATVRHRNSLFTDAVINQAYTSTTGPHQNSLFTDAVINQAYTSTTGPPPTKYLRTDPYSTAAVSHSPGTPFPLTSGIVGLAPAGSMGIPPSFRSAVSIALQPPSNAAPSTATQQQPFHYEDVAKEIDSVSFLPEGQVFSAHQIVWVQGAFLEQPHCFCSHIFLPEGRDTPEYLKRYLIAVKSAFHLGVDCIGRCFGDESRVPGELSSHFLPTYTALVHQWGIGFVPPFLYWLAKRADPNTQNPNNFTEQPPPRSSNAGFNEFSRLTGDPSSF
jgi:hypothetical protein